jgi:hypothetical protein
MIWRFSDGTTVELGGKVEGPTLLAQRLRERLERGVRVRIWAPPESAVDLDANDAAQVEAWLRDELRTYTQRDLALKLQSPDNIPALPPPPWANQPETPADIVH